MVWVHRNDGSLGQHAPKGVSKFTFLVRHWGEGRFVPSVLVHSSTSRTSAHGAKRCQLVRRSLAGWLAGWCDWLAIAMAPRSPTAADALSELHCQLAYTQSDEISLVFMPRPTPAQRLAVCCPDLKASNASILGFSMACGHPICLCPSCDTSGKAISFFLHFLVLFSLV